jgi:hypothetical protein
MRCKKSLASASLKEEVTGVTGVSEVNIKTGRLCPENEVRTCELRREPDRW